MKSNDKLSLLFFSSSSTKLLTIARFVEWLRSSCSLNLESVNEKCRRSAINAFTKEEGGQKEDLMILEKCRGRKTFYPGGWRDNGALVHSICGREITRKWVGIASIFQRSLWERGRRSSMNLLDWDALTRAYRRFKKPRNQFLPVFQSETLSRFYTTVKFGPSFTRFVLSCLD